MNKWKVKTKLELEMLRLLIAVYKGYGLFTEIARVIEEATGLEIEEAINNE